MLLIVLIIFFSPQGDKFRVIEYNGRKVKTTYRVEDRFMGTYKGRKTGFLELNSDGTGKYKYDVFAFTKPGCTDSPIEFEWGFLVDEGDSVVRFERDYGFSYPLLLKSVSETSFQGCRKTVMLDFIIEQNKSLSISSSDDWEK